MENAAPAEHSHAARTALPDVEFDLSYDSSGGGLIERFYLPALGCAVRYDRAVGYFRSSIFVMVGLAMSDFALAGGRMRMVCSPHLSPDDAAALQEGADLHDRLDEALADEIDRVLREPANVPVVQFLASLVASGVLDVRLAYPRQRQGIFHDKLGVFQDAAGHSLSFRGSANETLSAWDIEANHESFEVFRSWGEAIDAARVERHRVYFERLWLAELPNVVVVELGPRAAALLASSAHHGGLRAAHEDVRQRVGDRAPAPTRRIVLQEHQVAVIENWTATNRGIIDHVTGAGKTVTALEIARRWLHDSGPVLVLVPSLLLAKQWMGEIPRVIDDLDVAVLRADSEGDAWRGALRDFTTQDAEFGARLTVATLATASSDDFLRRIQGGDHLLVIADEVHRVGSDHYRRLLGVEAGGRLGLSATPQRFGDIAGTRALFGYFGPALPPPFTIADGIRAGRLVPYDYHVHLVELTHNEWEQWSELTDQIAPLVARTANSAGSATSLGDRLRFLLIQRARIKKQAENKVRLAGEVLAERWREDARWLIYCDDQVQLRNVRAELERRGIASDEYHSAMLGARDETLSHFERRGGVLVAIRCLDEGVDIPAIDHALILASSVNEREFIQRRGRVLRTSEGTMKVSASIHDCLVTAPGGVATESVLPIELRRASEFAAHARNAAVRMQLARLQALADVGSGSGFEDAEDDALYGQEDHV